MSPEFIVLLVLYLVHGAADLYRGRIQSSHIEAMRKEHAKLTAAFLADRASPQAAMVYASYDPEPAPVPQLPEDDQEIDPTLPLGLG